MYLLSSPRAHQKFSDQLFVSHSHRSAPAESLGREGSGEQMQGGSTGTRAQRCWCTEGFVFFPVHEGRFGSSGHEPSAARPATRGSRRRRRVAPQQRQPLPPVPSAALKRGGPRGSGEPGRAGLGCRGPRPRLGTPEGGLKGGAVPWRKAAEVPDGLPCGARSWHAVAAAASHFPLLVVAAFSHR